MKSTASRYIVEQRIAKKSCKLFHLFAMRNHLSQADADMQQSLNGCRHSSVASSAPTRFESQVHNLHFFHLQYLCYFCHVKRTKKTKRGRVWPTFLKKQSDRAVRLSSICNTLQVIGTTTFFRLTYFRKVKKCDIFKTIILVIINLSFTNGVSE